MLREIPIERGDKEKSGGGGGRGFQGGRQSEALLWTVMPVSLTKKELTKGVLSGNPLLQVNGLRCGNPFRVVCLEGRGCVRHYDYPASNRYCLRHAGSRFMQDFQRDKSGGIILLIPVSFLAG